MKGDKVEAWPKRSWNRDHSSHIIIYEWWIYNDPSGFRWKAMKFSFGRHDWYPPPDPQDLIKYAKILPLKDKCWRIRAMNRKQQIKVKRAASSTAKGHQKEMHWTGNTYVNDDGKPSSASKSTTDINSLPFPLNRPEDISLCQSLPHLSPFITFSFLINKICLENHKEETEKRQRDMKSRNYWKNNFWKDWRSRSRLCPRIIIYAQKKIIYQKRPKTEEKKKEKWYFINFNSFENTVIMM